MNIKVVFKRFMYKAASTEFLLIYRNKRIEILIYDEVSDKLPFSTNDFLSTFWRLLIF